MKPLLKIGFLSAFVLCLASVTGAYGQSYQVTLAWDAKTEPDLEGYILYGNQWSPCPPYDYIDTYPVTEFADPLNPRCKVTDLEKDVIYYFVVTAYDTAGNESDFSNLVSSEGEAAYCSSGSGSGFAWGGSFITASAIEGEWAK